MDKDLLREKISETRHKEWESLATGIIGLILVLVALFFGFSVPSLSVYSGFRSGSGLLAGILATIFLVLGLAIMVAGAVAGMYYSRQRSKLMEQLR